MKRRRRRRVQPRPRPHEHPQTHKHTMAATGEVAVAATAAAWQSQHQASIGIPTLTTLAGVRRMRLVLADMLGDRGYDPPACLTEWDERRLARALADGEEGAEWLVAEPRAALAAEESKPEVWVAWKADVTKWGGEVVPTRRPPPRPLHVAAKGPIAVLFVRQQGIDALMEALEHLEVLGLGRAVLVLPDELNASAQKTLAEWMDDQAGSTVVETLMERELRFNVARRADGALAYRVVEDLDENRRLHRKFRGTTPPQLFHKDPVARYYGLGDCRGCFVRILYDSETAGLAERTVVIT